MSPNAHLIETVDLNLKENVSKIGKKGLWFSVKLLKPDFDPKLRDKEIIVLGDSGSSWSLISENFKNYAVEIKPIPSRLSLVGASGTQIPIKGIGIFVIKIGKIVVKTEFILVTDLNWPFTIVGLTLMEKLNSIIDLGKRTISLSLENGELSKM